MLVLTVTGCAAMMGTLRVKMEVSCDLMKPILELTEPEVGEIKASNISDPTLESINQIDNQIDKHNAKIREECPK